MKYEFKGWDWMAIALIMCGVWLYGAYPGIWYGPWFNMAGSFIWMPWCIKYKQWSVLAITCMMGAMHSWNWWIVI